jgi:hypothetical protein
MEGHSLLSRASSTGVLVNRRGIRHPSRSHAFADPLEVLYVLPRETLVLLDKLHECWRLVIGQMMTRASSSDTSGSPPECYL